MLQQTINLWYSLFKDKKKNTFVKILKAVDALFCQKIIKNGFSRSGGTEKTIDTTIFSCIRVDVFICCAVVRYLQGYSLASSTSCLCRLPCVLAVKVYLDVYTQHRL